MLKKLLTLVLGLVILSAYAQEDAIEQIGWGEAGKKPEKAIQSVPLKKGDVLIQGFSKKISGKDISWHSHLDYAKEAMIVRTNKGVQEMVWESESVPANVSSDELCLVWISGVSGLNGKKPAPIRLYANDKKVAEFFTAGEKDWDVTGENGAQLSFREHSRDGSDDRYGFMFLRLPREYVVAGEPVRLRFEARDIGVDSWTMVFKSDIRKKEMTAACTPAFAKASGKQIIKLNYPHIGATKDAVVNYGKHELKTEVSFGENYIDLPIDRIKKNKKLTITLTVGSESYTCDVKLKPARNWDVNFIQITHTDIGYTRPQTDILSDHIRFIDYVLDFCDATDHYPDESKFRWTCENTWAVTEFLKIRPKSQTDRFIQRVKEGRIELTAMNLNFDGMSDEQAMAASLAPLKTLKEYGFDVPKVAMQNDVNGIAWCLNEYFPEIGVKYLTMGVNNYYQVAPFDMPAYFWWTSPSGKRMLAYYGEHYMHGNFLGVNGKSFENFEKKMLDYLEKLNDKGFAYDIVGLEFLGIGGDNSAPSTYACDIVKQWNEKYESPKLSLSLFSNHLEQIEDKYGEDIPAIQGAWPDWWDLGYAASARETAASRLTHSEVISNQVGFSLAKLAGSTVKDNIAAQIAEVNQTILFYDEHTFGFDASVRRPYHRETMEQRAVKESYAWEAFRRNRMLRENALGLLSEHISKAQVPSVTVFNPSSWRRTGLARTYIDDSMLPEDKKFILVDENGKSAPCQKHQRKHDGAYWYMYVEDVPALGYKQYYIKSAQNQNTITMESSSRTASKTVENDWYKIAFDLEKGCINRLFDKELGQELLDTTAPWMLGELIHEQLTDRFPEVPVKDPRRNAPSIRFIGIEKGQIWDTYKFKGHSDAGHGAGDNLYVEIRIFKTTKQLDLSYRLKKKLETNPEAIYVAFPFELPGGKIHHEVPGGVAEVGVDQIIGTSNDWNTVQTFASVKNDKAQIVMGTAEIPMMQFGDINIGRFQKESVPASNKIYSWVMNNYWTTNFNAYQLGEFEWNYFLTSMSGNSNADATQFAWENRVPFLVRVLPAGTKKMEIATSKSYLSIVPENVALVNMSPVVGEDAILVHLREIAGKSAEIKISSDVRQDLKVVGSDVLGRENVDDDLYIKPLETKFVKISW